VRETARLYGVLDRRLADRPFVAGNDYSIADMASYPWIVPYDRQGQKLEDFPHLKRWFEAVEARPGTRRAYAVWDRYKDLPPPSDDERRRNLFGAPAQP
jgi:GST-like protein